MPTDSFKDLVRTYAFLAVEMVGREAFILERESLRQIVTTCDSLELPSTWAEFKGRPMEQQHNKLVARWKEHGVTRAAIESLDFEYERFSDEVKDFTRRRRAGEKPQDIVMQQLRALLGLDEDGNERTESDFKLIANKLGG